MSDEHIIAFCLGNDAVLPKASCDACAKLTSYLEGYAGRQVFGPMRKHFRIQSRRKSSPLGTVDVRFIRATGEETRSVQRNLLPTMLSLPLFPAAGLLEDRAPAPIHVVDNWIWFAEDPAQRMSKLLQPGEFGWQLPAAVNGSTFARMLAKIAHSIAVGWLGISAYEHLLPPLILGNDPNIGYPVGGAEGPTEPDPPIPYGPKTHHHTLKVIPMSSPGKRDILAVNIRLFKHIGTPSYWVIVGFPTMETVARLKDTSD
ncbi:hypothetical protein LPB73_07670 [Tardiphaga sp. 37S4]|uniref:hypothetical protein n=1 Tax=Tardiphaga sp. 37S4 TaxID=1404741 RepID=UPI001E3F4553|nr:hypothetical protein [Tardiphaga sp. 37S4]UFS77246.1 hypothetical protein LPB73_07670 [Tardiphaga sp. 37S4]